MVCVSRGQNGQMLKSGQKNISRLLLSSLANMTLRLSRGMVATLLAGESGDQVERTPILL